MIANTASQPLDPANVIQAVWPGVHLYNRQWEIVYSVRDNSETFVPAANMVGKDFVAGLIALGAFLAPNVFLRHPEDGWLGSSIVRIVTTSVRDDHLRVLWGEIGQFLQAANVPLRIESGGVLLINHHDIRKLIDGQQCPLSYLRGMVSAKGEGMAGHHAPHTLLIVDEASGVDDQVYTAADTWAARKLVFGNPWPCNNFFYRAVDGGDQPK